MIICAGKKERRAFFLVTFLVKGMRRKHTKFTKTTTAAVTSKTVTSTTTDFLKQKSGSFNCHKAIVIKLPNNSALPEVLPAFYNKSIFSSFSHDLVPVRIVCL